MDRLILLRHLPRLLSAFLLCVTSDRFFFSRCLVSVCCLVQHVRPRYPTHLSVTQRFDRTLLLLILRRCTPATSPIVHSARSFYVNPPLPFRSFYSKTYPSVPYFLLLSFSFVQWMYYCCNYHCAAGCGRYAIPGLLCTETRSDNHRLAYSQNIICPRDMRGRYTITTY